MSICAGSAKSALNTVELIDCAFAPRREAQIMRSDMAHLMASESATADELRNLCVDGQPRMGIVGEPVDLLRRPDGWPRLAQAHGPLRRTG